MKTPSVGLFCAGFIFLSLLLPAEAQPFGVSTVAGSSTNPGNSDGTNSNAQFNSPKGLALDSAGSLFVVDGNAIRQLTRVAGEWVVQTRAGAIGLHTFADGTNGAARFNYPQQVAVDAAGNLYVADTYNNAIRKVTRIGSDWVVSTIAGPLPPIATPGSTDGLNNNTRFNNPYGLTVDSTTNIYVADSLNHTIRRISPSGTNWLVSTLAGSPGVSGTNNDINMNARFNKPSAVSVDSAGSLYVTDFGNHTIRKMTRAGTDWTVTTLAGAPGLTGSVDGLGEAARFYFPQNIVVGNAGNLFVTDSGNETIRTISPAGWVSTIAGSPGLPGTVDGIGNAARFNEPYGIVVDPSGTLHIADFLGYVIRQAKPIPSLHMSLTGSQVVLSWPSTLVRFFPEACPALPSPGWTPLPTDNIVLGDQYYLQTNSAAAPQTFYRLYKQLP
jgi:sugar lactone lactonase YvrE